VTYQPEPYDPDWKLTRPSTDPELTEEEREYAQKLEESLESSVRQISQHFEAFMREERGVPGIIAQRVMSSVLTEIGASVTGHLLSNTRLEGEDLETVLEELVSVYRDAVRRTRDRSVVLVKALDAALKSGETTEQEVTEWIEKQQQRTETVQ
jgi:hypothetical protein